MNTHDTNKQAHCKLTNAQNTNDDDDHNAANTHKSAKYAIIQEMDKSERAAEALFGFTCWWLVCHVKKNQELASQKTAGRATPSSQKKKQLQ